MKDTKCCPVNSILSEQLLVTTFIPVFVTLFAYLCIGIIVIMFIKYHLL